MVRVAINGFGRIGRLVFRAGINSGNINFVAVNDPADINSLAYLLEYDSVHGKFPGKIRVKGDNLIVNGKKIAVSGERDPTRLPWKELKVDVVIESTGVFRTRDLVAQHLIAGAKKVMISAPAKGDKPVKTIVVGVNDNTYNKKTDSIISTASCTTNCLSPVAKVLNDKFGIIKGFLTTVHSYTSTQNLVDGDNKDFRRGRAAGANMIPTTTGATIATALTIPALEGKIDGMAIRVPTLNGSLIDFVAVLKKKATVEQINKAMENASKTKLKGILEYSEEPLVSTDIIGNPASAIFDARSTMAVGNMVKVIAWYDNEWGYSCRMIDMTKKMM